MKHGGQTYKCFIWGMRWPGGQLPLTLDPEFNCRNQHSVVFQIPSAYKDSYKKSFFPQTIRDKNALPDSLISSVELSDDCVSKFTSLVRATE